MTNEIHKLDHSVDETYEEINRSFQAFINVIEKRREGVLSAVKKLADDKKKVLQVTY